MEQDHNTRNIEHDDWEDKTPESANPANQAVIQYPLDVMYCPTDDDRVYMSKGHHQFDEFITACEVDNGGALHGVWRCPEYRWWRFVPSRPDSEFNGFYRDARPHSRGAFPVTVMVDE